MRGTSWIWHALLCLVCLAVLAPSPPVPVRPPGVRAERALLPGVRAEAWRKVVENAYGALFVDDVLVLTREDRIEGRDARSGRTSWTFSVSDLSGYAPPEEQLEATGDYVVAVAPPGEEEGDDPQGDSLLTFNGRTGTILWQLTTGPYGSGPPTPYLEYLSVGRGLVFVHLPALGVVRALDVVDGRRRWEAATPSGCTHVSGDADDRVVALLVTCGRRTRLRVLGSATGRPLWERDVFPVGTPVVEVSGGAVGVESDDALTVYDSDGRQLYEHVVGRTCSCSIAATDAGLLVMRMGDVDDSSVMEAVDRRTGHVSRISAEAGEFATVQVVDGRVYGTRQLGGDLQGSVIVLIDPASGKQTPVVTFPLDEELTAIGRDALLVAGPAPDEDDTTLIAYRTVPPREPGSAARGGVDWPDACALVPPSALAAEFPGARYTFRPRPAPPELGLDTPTGCDLVPADDEHPVIALAVLWVGRTPDEAEAVLEAMMERFRVSPDRIVSHKSGARLYVDEKPQDAVIVRAGDTLVRMDGAGERDTAVRLILRVARVLGTAT